MAGDPNAAAETFVQHRRHLAALAYRMLGTVAEAEDVMQDAYLRWSKTVAAGGDDIAEPRAYLTRIVVRLCLDQLKSARRQRESYVGTWLPAPVITEEAPSTEGLAHDLSMALLLLLERLTPRERAAFVLHDVFDMDFPAVAALLDATPEACRQLATRARRTIRIGAPRFQPSPDERQELLLAFLLSARTGDVGRLATLLADDAVLISDGGGRRPAALKPILGADRIARFFIGILTKEAFALPTASLELATVNDLPGLLVLVEGRIERAIAVDLAPDRRIRAIYMVLNPDKLANPRFLVGG